MNLARASSLCIRSRRSRLCYMIDGTGQPNDRDKANGPVPVSGVTIQIINGGVAAAQMRMRSRLTVSLPTTKSLLTT